MFNLISRIITIIKQKDRLSQNSLPQSDPFKMIAEIFFKLYLCLPEIKSPATVPLYKY